MKVTRRSLLPAPLGLAVAQTAPPRAETRTTPIMGRRFTGEGLREIAFPLGGIGTGTVSLGGFGNLRDWEIWNRPNKGFELPFAFAALRLHSGSWKRPLVRVLERRSLPPYSGGHGVRRETALGLPRFREAVFTGAYPVAQIAFRDPRLPVAVALEAFNPMVPLDVDRSSLPMAVLTYNITSRASAPMDCALAFSLPNPVGYDGAGKFNSRRAEFFGQNRNEFRDQGALRGLLLSSTKHAADSPRYGSMALTTSATDTSYRAAWEHGAWWDEFQKWWDEFVQKGRFASQPAPPSEDKASEYATLAAHFRLEPGETRSVPFVISWHFPNFRVYWSNEPESKDALVHNDYGSRWPSAWEPARHYFENAAALRRDTLGYRDALHSSTLPAAVIDAVSSQASILRTPTVMVLQGGHTLAFEGCNDNSGCCPMNCTHVYNYEQAIAHLYPQVERSMRETDFLINTHADGFMTFRTPVPLRPTGGTPFPAADGQMGCVLKLYREWLFSGDDDWLRKLWPSAKRALEYAWVRWDKDRDGVMEDEQHNTYDIEFYGPNSMMGAFYLGALLAASRMARHLGDPAADSYQALYESGSRKLDPLLWNGEYYVQKVDETKEKAARYQYGEGCLSDQLLGQWFAELVGLGKLLPAEHVRTALASIFRYNFRQDFSDFANAQRLYVMNDEKGLLLCSWPHGKRPALPFVYSDEVWTGIEYQVASHLIYEGMVKEGLAVTAAVRERYNGASRNPWNEVECGHHYARAMASWGLLTALSGFHYSAPERSIRFRPRVNETAFRALFACGNAWGTYSQELQAGAMARIAVAGGGLELQAVSVPCPNPSAKVRAPRGATATIRDGMAEVRLKDSVRLAAGDKLTISLA